jgi:hypothetical protein
VEILGFTDRTRAPIRMEVSGNSATGSAVQQTGNSSYPGDQGENK